MCKSLIRAFILSWALVSSATAVDLVWEPTELVIDVPTTVSIYIQANESLFRYGAGAFGLVQSDGTPSQPATPDGGLYYDVDGPDNTDFTEDDGWIWHNGLAVEPPSGIFDAQVNPPETAYVGTSASPFVVLPNDRLLAATLDITGSELGVFRLIPSHQHFDDSFREILIKEGAEPVFHVIPEPGTLLLLAFGVIGTLPRGSKSVSVRAPDAHATTP